MADHTDVAPEPFGHRITVLGLGYVGAPLAFELAKYFEVTGFDINADRINELREGRDRTGELEQSCLREARWRLTTQPACLAQSDVIILTVPTPVDQSRVPDLGPLLNATRLVGAHLKRGTTVVYESTVYPGVTEDLCIPLLVECSGLQHREHFHVGYSPERINPGDRVHTLTTTVKIVSGDCAATRDRLAALYGKITRTFAAQSIRVAEAAKVIENTQRDVNIALINELSQLFNRLNVDTADVLEAARSKWNFLDFRPGLVGGHCISVDPYYLTHKAASHGFTASLILAAREINDSMAAYLADQFLRRMAKRHLLREDTVVTILGATFKEDVPDSRNSKVAEIVLQLRGIGLEVQVADPLAVPAEVAAEFGYSLTDEANLKPADALILAVPHAAYRRAGWNLLASYCKPGQQLVVLDLKSILDNSAVPAHVDLWRP